MAAVEDRAGEAQTAELERSRDRQSELRGALEDLNLAERAVLAELEQVTRPGCESHRADCPCRPIQKAASAGAGSGLPVAEDSNSGTPAGSTANNAHRMAAVEDCAGESQTAELERIRDRQSELRGALEDSNLAEIAVLAELEQVTRPGCESHRADCPCRPIQNAASAGAGSGLNGG